MLAHVIVTIHALATVIILHLVLATVIMNALAIVIIHLVLVTVIMLALAIVIIHALVNVITLETQIRVVRQILQFGKMNH
jgi:hypothetical protein